MKIQKFNRLVLVIVHVFLGCKQNTESKASDFKVAQHYTEFATKMENNDTLNIGVNLSMCMWGEYDQLQITKSNDTIYLQLIEKLVMEDDPLHFQKVRYELKNDTLSLEKMMSTFDTSYQEKRSSPFFTLINPKENDTMVLRTTGLGNRGSNIRWYQDIMFALYPKEMEKYRKEYMTPPPPPLHEIKEITF